jgi:integrase
MNIVDPITDEEIIKSIEGYLKRENDRDYILFLLGLHTGLRISDILRIRADDIYKKNILKVKEIKTGKVKDINLSTKLKREVNKYIEKNEMKGEYFLIKSRKGFNNSIGREQAYKIIKAVCILFGVDNVGTHTMRKTFGYMHYKKYRDIEALRKYFNHSDSTVTTRYIGLQQEIINKQVKELWT